MNKQLLILIILLSCIPARFLWGRSYFRSELLDEGRRFTNTIDYYHKISDKKYPGGFDAGFIIFPGYSVDTWLWKDKVLVGLGHFDAKINLTRWFTFYLIAHIYDVRSKNRQELQVTNLGTSYAPSFKDGHVDYALIKYGLLAEVLMGADFSYKDYFKFNISGIYSYEELNNSFYDYRFIDGMYRINNINFTDRGRPLYLEMSERKKNSLHPVFGLSVLDFLHSFVNYSFNKKTVTATETIFRYKVHEKAGYVLAGHTLYKYWNNEHGILVGMDKIFGVLGFGSEFIVKKLMFTNFYIKAHGQIKLKGGSYFDLYGSFNMTRTPETINIRSSQKFVPGGKIEAAFHGGISGPDARNVFFKFKAVYNDYTMLKVFRGSIDKWGFGIAIGFNMGTNPLFDFPKKKDKKEKDKEAEKELEKDSADEAGHKIGRGDSDNTIRGEE